MNLLTMVEVAKTLDVSYCYVHAALFKGWIPEPKTRLGSRRLWTKEEVEELRTIFAKRKKWQRWNKGDNDK